MNIPKQIFLLTIVCLSFSFFSHSQCPEGMTTSNSNLVMNGNFNLGNTGFQTAYKPSKSLTNEGLYAIVSDPKFVHEKFSGCPNHSSKTGKMMVVNGAPVDNMVVWAQTITIKKNTTYFFSIWICTVNEPRQNTSNPARLQFSINNQLPGTPFVATDTTCYWKQYYTCWYSGDANTASISIINKNILETGNDFALDDIVFYECGYEDLQKQLMNAKPGTPVQCNSIGFESGNAIIKKESYKELDLLAEYLIKNPTLKLNIAGHTDNSGKETDNLILSKQRATAIGKYLESKGINKNRLILNGYGSAKPIASNETSEGRQKNRRVEFIIQ